MHGTAFHIIGGGGIDVLSRVEIRHLCPHNIVSVFLKSETAPGTASVLRLAAFEMDAIERLLVHRTVADVARIGLVPLDVKDGADSRHESQGGQDL